MSEDVRSIGNWAKELGISDKQLKAALKAGSIEAGIGLNDCYRR